MLYYSFLRKEPLAAELWVRRDGNLWPVFDYKIDVDKLCLISNPDVSIPEAVDLDELVQYVQKDGNAVDVPYRIVDELTGQNLDIKDRFEHKLVFEICN